MDSAGEAVIMDNSLLQVQVLFQEECGDGVKNATPIIRLDKVF